jgi:hypothetical protein
VAERNKGFALYFAALLLLCEGSLIGCQGTRSPSVQAQESSAAANHQGSGATASTSSSDGAPPAADAAPPASQTAGFDGQKAYDFTAKLVSFGPRPPDSPAIHQAQDYIRSQLQSFGCTVTEDNFHAGTPVGSVAMKNIVAVIPGEKPSIILLLTHYDTDQLDQQDQHMDNFVGANDGGSSSGLMLEMARNLCGKKQTDTIWIAFLDGEEAFQKWSDTDSIYGSRELAARMALSGDLSRIRAVMLADMIGAKNLHVEKDPSSPWLTDLVWSTAARLGYSDVFVSTVTPMEDDHLAFTHRKVPAVDVIDYMDYPATTVWPYWHTPQDTMDKISPRSLAIVGHVFIESVRAIEARK